MSNSVIQIIQLKRSTTNDAPISLNIGEPAYSYVSNTLFIGTPSETGVLEIGGHRNVLRTNAAFIRANNSLNANVGGLITGDVTIQGNLNITGGSIAANVPVVLIGDNIISLNTAVNQSGQPTMNAGIEIDRGAQPNVYLLWNETDNKWTFTNDGTNYDDLGGSAASLYANAAFIKANAAYDNSNTKVSKSGDRMTGSLEFFGPNLAVGNYQYPGGIDLWANSNAAYAQINYANTNFVYVDPLVAALQSPNAQISVFNTDGIIEFYSANLDSGNKYWRLYSNGDFVWSDGTSQNTSPYATSLYANSAFVKANGSFDHANAAFAAANNVFPQVQPAFNTANAAFIHANAAYDSQNTTGVVANAAFIQANAVFTLANGTAIAANTPSHVANSASLYANGAFVQANAVFNLANGNSIAANTPSHVANSAALYANGAFVQANAVFTLANGTAISANTPSHVANSAALYANGAFIRANTPSHVSNSAALYANGAFVQANAAFIRANNSLNANTGGQITGDVIIVGNLTSNTLTTTGSNGSITGANAIFSNYIFANNVDLSLYTSYAFANANAGLAAANAAFITANAAFANANAGLATANAALIAANAAFANANAGLAAANAAFANANAGLSIANAAFIQANASFVHANNGFIAANAAFVQANSGFVHANAAYDSQNVTGTYANNAFAQANAAFIRANNSLDANNGGTVTGNVTIAANLTTQNVYVRSYVDLNTAASKPVKNEGRLFYDNYEKSIAFYGDSDETIQIGQSFVRVWNDSGTTINKGKVVRIGESVSANGFPAAVLAAADVSQNAEAIGFTITSIANNSYGYVLVSGEVHDIDTSLLNPGQELFLSTTPGEYVTTPPAPPNIPIALGYILTSDVTAGSLLVHIHLMEGKNKTNGAILFGRNGAIDQDPTKLYWDFTNDRLGIDTDTPQANLHVAGDGLFTGNLSILGNLVISNAQTITTDQLFVGGNNVILSANVTGTPTLNAAIIVNRGSSPNAYILWDETVNEWLAYEGSGEPGHILVATKTANSWAVYDTFEAYEKEFYPIGANLANSINEHAKAGFTTANIAENLAVASFQQANSGYNHANAAYDSQNTTGQYANAAFIHANSGFVKVNSAFDHTNSSFIHANASFDKANNADANAFSAGTYANGAFLQANAAFNLANGTAIAANTPSHVANSAALYANGSFVQANAAFIVANTPSHVANSAALYANGAFIQANAAFSLANGNAIAANTPSHVANSAAVYANGAFIQSNAAFVHANSGFDKANNADANALSAGTYANGAFTFANSAGSYANAAFVVANGSFIHANASYDKANNADANALSAGAYANSVFELANGTAIVANTPSHVANSAAVYANGAFVQSNAVFELANGTAVVANTPSHVANSAALYANGAFVQANAAFDLANGTAISANTPSHVANSAAIYANGAFDFANSASIAANTPSHVANSAAAYANGAFVQANAVFDLANGVAVAANTPSHVANSASIYANGSFVQANAVFDLANGTAIAANTPSHVANSAATYANGAFVQANSTFDLANGTAIAANTPSHVANSAAAYANGAFAQANAAYNRANNSLDANTGGSVTGDVIVVGTVRSNVSAGDEGGQFEFATPQTNTTLNGPIAIDVYQNKLRFFETTGTNRGAYIDLTAAGTGIGSDLLAGGGGSGADQYARDTANAAFIHANSAFIAGNGTAIAANTPSHVANSAALYANGAFNAANTADDKAVTAGSYANSAFVLANGTAIVANTPSHVANSAALYANGAFVQANAAFSLANGNAVAANTPSHVANSASLYANGAFVQSNAAFIHANTSFELANGTAIAANTPSHVANSAALYANGAFAQANAAFIHANSAFDNSNTKFNSTGGTISGNVTIQNDLSVLGNVNFVGNVTSLLVTGNSGQFFGYAANGFNALYAGIPVGYDFQPQTVFQASGNVNDYAQINIQNINSGDQSSSDYVATADNGTESDTYIDMGIGGSTHADPDYTLVGPNDGYLYVSGNTVTGGGDLVLGTFIENDIVFAVGGMGVENEQMRIIGTSNTINIRANLDTSISKSVLLGPVDNVHITGGTNDDYIRTDGAGNLTFAPLTSANVIKVLYNTANASFITANTPSHVANSAALYANGAFIQSNAAFDLANGNAVAANTPSHVANSAALYANAAFIRANNSLSANAGGTVTANVVINANLQVANVTTNTYIQFGDGTRQYTANAGSGGGGGGNTAVASWSVVADGSNTSYLMDFSPTSNAGVVVSIGGIVQSEIHDYTINPSNNTISFNEPPPSGQRIRVGGFSNVTPVYVDAANSAGATVYTFEGLGNGSTQLFNLGFDPISGKAVFVSLGGILQPESAYVVNSSNNTIYFIDAPQVNENIRVVGFSRVNPFYTSVINSNVSVSVFETTANGAQTTFQLAFNPQARETLIVTIDGIVQPITSYTVDTGTYTITFDETPASGELVRVATFYTAANAFIIPDGSVSVAKLDASINSTVQNAATTGKAIAMSIVFGG